MAAPPGCPISDAGFAFEPLCIYGKCTQYILRYPPVGPGNSPDSPAAQRICELEALCADDGSFSEFEARREACVAGWSDCQTACAAQLAGPCADNALVAFNGSSDCLSYCRANN